MELKGSKTEKIYWLPLPVNLRRGTVIPILPQRLKKRVMSRLPPFFSNQPPMKRSMPKGSLNSSREEKSKLREVFRQA